jgi:hypothetical protein
MSHRQGLHSVPRHVRAVTESAESDPRAPRVEVELGEVAAPWIGDALVLWFGTRWQESEVERFAVGGSFESPDIAVLPMPGADPRRTRLVQDVFEAAKRLRAHGALAPEWRDARLKARRAELAALRALAPEQREQIAPKELDQAEDDVAALEKLRQLSREIPVLLDASKPTEQRLAALRSFFKAVYRIGVERGAASERRKIERMATRRRSPKRPEIERLLISGQTIGQVVVRTRASERTIKRVRSELKARGLL